MTKNQVLKIVIEELMSQRSELIHEVKNLNHNESSWGDRKFTLENSISNIDMNLNVRIMELEK
jgi:hypothetical protein